MAVQLKAKSFKIAGATVGATGTTYADKDCIGTLTKLENPCGDPAGYCTLMSVVIQDLSAQNSKLELVFFDADPTGTTFTDDSALDIADADLTKVVGTVVINAGDYQTYNDNSVATVSNIGLEMQSASDKDLWFVVVSRGTPTYVASELSIVLAFLQDSK